MYDLYYSDEIIFVRHFDEFERAEIFRALFDIANWLSETEYTPAAIWFDTKAVTGCTLQDSDIAYRDFSWQKLISMSPNLKLNSSGPTPNINHGLRLAKVLYTDSPGYRDLLERAKVNYERDTMMQQAVSGALYATAIATFIGHQPANAYLNLPADHEPKWTELTRVMPDTGLDTKGSKH